MNENRWALLIGACEYQRHPKLRYAAADAVEFRKAIVDNLGFERQRVVVLADPEDADDPCDDVPTRNNIFDALGLFGNRSSDLYTERGLPPMGEDDLFLFYFSGHGMRTTDDGTEHLLGVDAGKWSVRDTAVSLDKVVDLIEAFPCRHKVLFLDACRDEFFDDAGAKSAGGSKGIGAPSVVEREGLATFYSCDPLTRSYELDDLKHGSFTHCLLEAIKHEEVNTLDELDRFLQSRVPTLNAERGKDPQLPYAVLKPLDMRDVALFEAARRDEEQEDFIAMTNELYETKRIRYEWWVKLSNIWDAGAGPNIRLQKRIFGEFYSGGISQDEFESRWRRTERTILGTISPPAAGVAKLPKANGDGSAEPPGGPPIP